MQQTAFQSNPINLESYLVNNCFNWSSLKVFFIASLNDCSWCRRQSLRNIRPSLWRRPKPIQKMPSSAKRQIVKDGTCSKFYFLCLWSLNCSDPIDSWENHFACLYVNQKNTVKNQIEKRKQNHDSRSKWMQINYSGAKCINKGYVKD